MAQRDVLPFERGTSAATIQAGYLGRKFTHTRRDYSSSSSGIVAPIATGADVRVMLVKNSSGIALLPSRLVKFKAGTNYTEVDGYARLTAEPTVAVVDDYLPSTGVPNGEYFYVVIGGPVLALTDLAGADNNVINENDFIIALTGATSQATTAGRVYSLPSAAASTQLGTHLLGVFAKALSARTTANTNSSVLINMYNLI